MARLIFLGTCSGTEPMPERHHASVVLEVNDRYYWFDAGENCSHAAYTSGVDVSRVRAVFVSHAHIDHIGGLANLLFTFWKVALMTKRPHVNGNSYDLFFPDEKKLGHVKAVAGIYFDPEHSGETRIGLTTHSHGISDGVLFEDENVRVTALHNTHLKESGENGWHSFSFLIETEGKRIVYSGDVGRPEDLDPFLDGGCDVLVMETGHHKVGLVASYASEKRVGRLLYTHHGREILRDPAAAEVLAASIHPSARVMNDGDVVET